MRTVRCLAALAGVALLAGCGGGKPAIAEAAAPTAKSSQYDVYLQGITTTDGGGSGLYGLNLNPLKLHRVAGESVAFEPSARGGQIVVKAAEDSKLGLLLPDGTVGPIPGLGRPEGTDPVLLPDGRIRWSDDGAPTDKHTQRYVEWNPATKKTRVLDRDTSKRHVEYGSGPGDGYLKAVETKADHWELAVVTAKKTTTFTLPGQPLALSAGAHYIAAWVDKPRTARKPGRALLILDPAKGIVADHPGVAPIAWSPGGKRLLAAVESPGGKPMELREYWFNPGAVANRPIGEIPSMQLEDGTWRTGIPAPMCKDCPDQPTAKDY